MRGSLSSLVLTERIRHRVAYNPFADAITQDPYPTYAALRARSPVHRSLLTHAWVLTRYADVDAVLRDHRRFSNDPRRREAAHRGIGALPAGPDDYSRLLLDPPEHTRLRRLVNEAFTPLAIEALEPRIRTITAELLERVATPTSCDLVRDVAQPLPLRVIMWMLGVPPESFRRFEVWSKQRARLLELTVSARERAGARAAGRGMDDLTWTEVDFDSRVWTVPAERMKAGCLHRVPLARQALDLLERTRTLSRSGSLAFVRYGRGRPRRVGDAAVNKLLQRLGLVDDTGCKVTVHGFRSTYRV